MVNSDYTPAQDKKILNAMKKKGATRKAALEKVAKAINKPYNTILARGYMLSTKKKRVVKDHSGSMKTVTTTVRIKYKTVTIDPTSSELVFTV